MSTFQDPETYRTILESLQSGVCVVDIQQRILFWNDGAQRITGHPRIEVLGHSYMKNILVHCNQVSCQVCTNRCPIRDAFHEGKSSYGVVLIHHRAGHRVPVHTWTIPLRDQHGAIIAVIQNFEAQRDAAVPDPDADSMQAFGYLDNTTGLANHIMMESRLRETLGTFSELQVPFGILCLSAVDLPLFRSKYGQDAATSILRVLGRTLRNTVWPTDFVGRWEEDQFLIILHGCGEAGLQSVSDRILRTVATATIEWWGEELALALSISGTVAQAGDTEESILQRARQTVGEEAPTMLPNSAAASQTPSPAS